MYCGAVEFVCSPTAVKHIPVLLDECLAALEPGQGGSFADLTFGGGGHSRAILEASISLARKLDMQVVAEGVETRDDWDLAEELGVDYVQGFYCARPMSNGDLLDLLQQWQGPHHGAGD